MNTRGYGFLILLLLLQALPAQPSSALTGQETTCPIKGWEPMQIIRRAPPFSLPGIPPLELAAADVRGFPVAFEGNIVPEYGGPPHCDVPDDTYITDRKYHWSLERPSASMTQLNGAEAQSVTFTPDLAGAYVLHLRGSASYRGHTVTVSEGRMTLNVQNAAQLPPYTKPIPLPSANQPGTNTPMPATAPQHYGLPLAFCQGKVFVADGWPEWFTTSIWTAPKPPPYEHVEGRIYDSLIAASDNPLAHDSNDVNAKFELDPPFRRLLVDDHPEDKNTVVQSLPFGGLELEWEYGEYPEFFRPVVGDRMSALGFHIWDCGHDGYTELHPPIAIAVHRPRPVRLPAQIPYELGSQTVEPIGTDVYVPGIVTDVLVSLRGGEIINDDGALSQPRTIPFDQGDGTTIPVPVDVGQPTVAGVTFEFHVFLPPSPYYLLNQLQLSPAFKPNLYIHTGAHPHASAAGASSNNLVMKLVEQYLDGPAPYLRFAIDLSQLPAGQRYAQRIEAAWVYPDVTGANYGLSALQVVINQLKVTDTGNYTTGNWRFWAVLPGTDTPWVKLIDCDGCVSEQSYGPTDHVWQSGAMAADGSLLSGDVLKFRGQDALMVLTGYDSDLIKSDRIGNGNMVVSVGGVIPPIDSGSGAGCDGCPSYLLRYSVRPGHTPVTEHLNAAAKLAFERLLVHPAVARRFQVPAETELYLSDRVSQARLMIMRNDERKEDNLFGGTEGKARLREALKGKNAEALVVRLRRRALAVLGPHPSVAARAKMTTQIEELRPDVPTSLYRKYLCEQCITEGVASH